MSYPSTQLYPSGSLYPSTPGRVLFVEQDLSVTVAPVSYSASLSGILLSGEPTAISFDGDVSVVVLGGIAATP